MIMNIIRYPDKSEWADIIKRPVKSRENLDEIVNGVLRDVKLNGDSAVRKYELKFDKIQLNRLDVSDDELEHADDLVDNNLKEAILHAYRNIKKFHSEQVFKSNCIETDNGIKCWQKALPIQKVGLYIPGGTAPLFSTVLMLATPAQIAGCNEVVLCSPPDRNGNINPAVLFAAKISGVKKIYKIGGVQAIAAMAYGTETVPKVYKIFGPGNQYVMAAKQAVSVQDVAIDMPAGPSEVAVVADKTSNPIFVAADLLSQAEHGADSQVLLLSDDENVLMAVKEETEKLLMELPRRAIAEGALDNSSFLLVHNLEEAMSIVNEYAPEHLILAVDKPEEWTDKVLNAGSVFLGHFSCESAGDYASGTNHTLPTNGYAKAYSGVSLDSFVKKISFQQLSEQGIKSIANTVEIMAHNEMLYAHENAMKVRREYLFNLDNDK